MGPRVRCRGKPFLASFWSRVETKGTIVVVKRQQQDSEQDDQPSATKVTGEKAAVSGARVNFKGPQILGVILGAMNNYIRLVSPFGGWRPLICAVT